MQEEAVITRLIGRVFTHTVVRVVSVEPGGPGPVGFLSAVDLVQQLDSLNQGIPNQPMHRLPYFRLQGGANAVIIDPKPGDIGLASFAMRDITNVKKTRDESAPPSRRQYDCSDGLYIGGFLNGAPSQFIEFLESGINVVATGPVRVTTPDHLELESGSFKLTTGQAQIDAELLTINAPINSTGNVAVAGGVAATGSVADGAGSMEEMRDVYNGHDHISASPGNPTSPPSEQM